VYANKIAEMPQEERQAFIEQRRAEYREEIDIYRLASEMIVDEVIEPYELREALVKRLRMYQSKQVPLTARKNGVRPV